VSIQISSIVIFQNMHVRCRLAFLSMSCGKLSEKRRFMNDRVAPSCSMALSRNDTCCGSTAVGPEVIAVVISEVAISAPVAMPREQVSLVFNPGSAIA
jgi:hypothetical protein